MGKEIKLLLDQLYRFESMLGKYNCQQGGTKCEFQVNCHRLLREEIEVLKRRKHNISHYVHERVDI